MACKTEHYHQCEKYQKCFELTSALLEKDPFHLKCTLVHLAAAMELGHSNELYLMACNLVKDYPQKWERVYLAYIFLLISVMMTFYSVLHCSLD